MDSKVFDSLMLKTTFYDRPCRFLSATPNTGLDRLVLPEDLGKLRCCRDALQVLNRGRRSLPHVGIQQEPAREEERGRHHQVSERQLLADQVLLAALDGVLDLLQRALERRGGEVVPRLVVGLELEHHDQGRGGVRDELRVGEERPLGDLGLGLEVGAEQLPGEGPAAGEVGGDGRALGQGEAVGALEGWDLAERELGEELRCLVCLAELELGHVDLKTVQGGDDLSLEDCQRDKPDTDSINGAACALPGLTRCTRKFPGYE